MRRVVRDDTRLGHVNKNEGTTHLLCHCTGRIVDVDRGDTAVTGPVLIRMPRFLRNDRDAVCSFGITHVVERAERRQGNELVDCADLLRYEDVAGIEPLDASHRIVNFPEA